MASAEGRGPIERFTRDRVSKFVWGSLLLAAIGGLAFTLVHRGNAIEDARLRAEHLALTGIQQVMAPHLTRSDPSRPIGDPEATSLREAIASSTLGEPPVARVRVWAPNGNLLFSTDASDADQLGAAGAVNDAVLAEAASGLTITRWGLTDVGGSDERGRDLVRTYSPVGRRAVVEVDQTREGTIAVEDAMWFRYQILAAVVVLLFLVLTFASLRDPLDPINTGVPFRPSSVPAGLSLIDDERLNAVEEVYRLAQDRVARLQERLEESETKRRALEGELQQARTVAATRPSGRPLMTRATTASPVESAPAEPVVEPATPPSAPVKRQPVRPAAFAEPPTRSQPAVEHEPPTRPEPAVADEAPLRPPPVFDVPTRPAAAAERPARAPAAASQEAPVTRRADVEPPTLVSVPDSDVLPDRSEEIPAGLEPAPMRAKPKRALRKRLADAGVATADARTIDVDDAKAHEAALETFIRLTESDRQHAETAQVDQGAVRAALARTAARKKPGGTRLQPHERPEERPGGPPPTSGD